MNVLQIKLDLGCGSGILVHMGQNESVLSLPLVENDACGTDAIQANSLITTAFLLTMIGSRGKYLWAMW